MTMNQRSRGRLEVLRREGTGAASHEALSKQAKSAAKQRGPARRQHAAQKAVRTKGHEGLSAAARKAARTRKRAA